MFGSKVKFSEVTDDDEIRFHEVVLFSRRNSGVEIGRLGKLFYEWDEANKALKKLIFGGAYNFGTIRTTKENGDFYYLGIQFTDQEEDLTAHLAVQDMITFYVADKKLGVVQPLMTECKRLTKEVLEGNYY
jgi:hypothetical protein